MTLPTTYRSQNGRETPIAKMVDEHLANAVAKLRRGGATSAHHPMLAALEAEQKKRANG